MPDSRTADPSPPSPEAVRQQLQAILASSSFVTAARARRFLTYIVEQTLAGQTDGIKELVLGIEVFDRAADFDPKIDTVVRVEAGKLRKRLEEYYAGEGVATPILIQVPKGGYVPQFQERTPSPAVEVPRPAMPRRKYVTAILAILGIVACAGWLLWHFRTPPPATTPSIAVLPFLNLSADPNNEYFTDGLAEELTDALCNAGGLRVAARTSAFMFKGKPVDVHEIGARLHVGFVVEGSVRKEGGQLKVTAQLIRTDDGYHVWSGSFERQISDVFAVQQELAGSMLAALQLKLTGAQSRRLQKSHTANQQAFDLYLQAVHAVNSFAPGSLVRAEQLFQRSIDADPAYALAYTGLAGALLQENIFSDRPAKELASKADAAVQRALALDSELPEAHTVRGILAARHHYDWTAAEGHFRRALELNPSSALAHYNLGQVVFAPQGRWKEALSESRLAAELDPLSPMIAMSEPWLAYLEGRHDAAVDGFRRLSAANSSDTMALGGLTFALRGKGDDRGALENGEKLQKLLPSTQTLAFIALVQARLGNPGAARKLLGDLHAQPGYVSPLIFAMLHLAVGENGEVFRYLEMAREQQESALIFARAGDPWGTLRNDPRYLTLLAELGLSDEQIHKNQLHTSADHR